MRRLILPLLLVVAAPARATEPTALWSTVNVCDSARHPNTIGVRGSMPAGRAGERMFMRFRVQYRSGADRAWHDVNRGGDSGTIALGPADRGTRQAGRLFRFAAPAAGTLQTLRGVVRFEWRRGSKVVRHATRAATAGRDAAAADPRGYSAAVCEIA